MTKKTLHILFLPSWYPSFDNYVNAIYFREQAISLQKAGVQVGVIYPEMRSLSLFSLSKLRKIHFQVTDEIDHDLPTYRLQGWNFLPRLHARFALYTSMAVYLFKAYVKKYGYPDLVHAQAALWGGYASVSIHDKFAVPIIVMEHDSRFSEGFATDLDKDQASFVYDKADQVLTVSSQLRKNLIDSGLVKPNKIVVVPNFIDMEFFSLPRDRANFVNKECFRFVAIGHLRPVKRFDMLLIAFSKVFLNDQTVRLDIVGDGPERAYLESLTRQLNLSLQVTFHGACGREQVRQILWSSNALALSSAYETFGIPLVEALATGIPVVTTDCGGPGDIVSAETGYSVPINDLDAFAQALWEVRHRQFNSELLRQSVVEKFSAKVVCAQLIDLYTQVLVAKKA